MLTDYIQINNIIMLAHFLIFAFVIIENIITYFIPDFIPNYDSRMNGRYRYLCTGKTLNNKRCKRRAMNSETCYNHT